VVDGGEVIGAGEFEVGMRCQQQGSLHCGLGGWKDFPVTVAGQFHGTVSIEPSTTKDTKYHEGLSMRPYLVNFVSVVVTVFLNHSNCFGHAACGKETPGNICGMRLLVVLLVPALSFAQRASGNPLDHLPKNIEVLTHFGERADISPDNERVAFMTKSFGDAMVVDLKTRVIQCLTCNVSATAFLRVMHLVTGDYILIGPDHFENVHISRTRDNELWYLSKERGAKPVKLGQKMSEGAAISKKTLKIAFSQTAAQSPDLVPEASRLMVADLDVSGVPKLVNVKTVYESKDRNCVLEAQDFYDSDTKMTFTCYEPEGHSSVMGIDLKTGAVTNFSKAPGTYNEVEGIFPDGLYTAVEADRQCEQLGGVRGAGNIDIWKLRLDGTGKNLTRLTFFNDYEGGKASNPVLSTDGRFMAFQSAKTTDPAGVGYGILVYWFKQ
jgi:hypothetical protein